MEKNKLTFILLFLINIVFSQTIKVNDVTLSYDKKSDTMILLIPDNILINEDSDWEKEITISQDYELLMTIGGQEVILNEKFYYFSGRKHKNGSYFKYLFPKHDVCKTKSMKGESRSFQHPPKGEYILTVNDICDGKWITNRKTNSIIIK